MSKESRTQFEKELQTFLRNKLGSYPYIKVNRNKIILDNKKGSKAVILFIYQNVSHTYVFYMNVYSTEITNFIDSIQPPYPSNFDNKDIVYNSYYLSEKKI